MTWLEEIHKKYGLVNSGESRETNSSEEESASGAELLRLFPTTLPATPTVNPNILICTYQGVCPYAENATSHSTRDCTSAQPVELITQDTTCAGNVSHQMIKNDEVPIKLSGERFEEKEREREEPPLRTTREKRTYPKDRMDRRSVEETNKVISLWNEGLTAREIAEIMGYAPTRSGLDLIYGAVRRGRNNAT